MPNETTEQNQITWQDATSLNKSDAIEKKRQELERESQVLCERIAREKNLTSVSIHESAAPYAYDISTQFVVGATCDSVAKPLNDYHKSYYLRFNMLNRAGSADQKVMIIPGCCLEDDNEIVRFSSTQDRDTFREFMRRGGYDTQKLWRIPSERLLPPKTELGRFLRDQGSQFPLTALLCSAGVSIPVASATSSFIYTDGDLMDKMLSAEISLISQKLYDKLIPQGMITPDNAEMLIRKAIGDKLYDAIIYNVEGLIVKKPDYSIAHTYATTIPQNFANSTYLPCNAGHGHFNGSPFCYSTQYSSLLDHTLDGIPSSYKCEFPLVNNGKSTCLSVSLPSYNGVGHSASPMIRKEKHSGQGEASQSGSKSSSLLPAGTSPPLRKTDSLADTIRPFVTPTVNTHGITGIGITYNGNRVTVSPTVPRYVDCTDYVLHPIYSIKTKVRGLQFWRKSYKEKYYEKLSKVHAFQTKNQNDKNSLQELRDAYNSALLNKGLERARRIKNEIMSLTQREIDDEPLIKEMYRELESTAQKAFPSGSEKRTNIRNQCHDMKDNVLPAQTEEYKQIQREVNRTLKYAEFSNNLADVDKKISPLWTVFEKILSTYNEDPSKLTEQDLATLRSIVPILKTQLPQRTKLLQSLITVAPDQTSKQNLQQNVQQTNESTKEVTNLIELAKPNGFLEMGLNLRSVDAEISKGWEELVKVYPTLTEGTEEELAKFYADAKKLLTQINRAQNLGKSKNSKSPNKEPIPQTENADPYTEIKGALTGNVGLLIKAQSVQDYKGAAALLKKSYNLLSKDQYLEIREQLIIATNQRGDNKATLSLINDACKLAGEEACDSQLLLWRATLAYREKDYKLAVQDAKRIIDKEQSNFAAIKLVVYGHEELNLEKESLPIIEKAKADFPDDKAKMGFLLLHEGKIKKDKSVLHVAFDELKRAESSEVLSELNECFAQLYTLEGSEINAATELCSPDVDKSLDDLVDMTDIVIKANDTKLQQLEHEKPQSKEEGGEKEGTQHEGESKKSEDEGQGLRKHNEMLKQYRDEAKLNRKLLQPRTALYWKRSAHLGADLLFDGLELLLPKTRVGNWRLYSYIAQTGVIGPIKDTITSGFRIVEHWGEEEIAKIIHDFKGTEKGYAEAVFSDVQLYYLGARIFETWVKYVCSKLEENCISKIQQTSENLTNAQTTEEKLALETALTNYRGRVEKIERWANISSRYMSSPLDTWAVTSMVYSTIMEAASIGLNPFSVAKLMLRSVLSLPVFTPIFANALLDDVRQGVPMSTQQWKLYIGLFIRSLNSSKLNKFVTIHGRAIMFLANEIIILALKYFGQAAMTAAAGTVLVSYGVPTLTVLQAGLLVNSVYDIYENKFPRNLLEREFHNAEVAIEKVVELEQKMRDQRQEMEAGREELTALKEEAGTLCRKLKEKIKNKGDFYQEFKGYYIFALRNEYALLERFKRAPAAPDGNCLFHAISYYTDEDHQELRQKAINYIENHEAEFSATIEGDAQLNFQAYIDVMRRGGNAQNIQSWGGEPEIRALEKVLRRPIIVVGGPNGRNFEDKNWEEGDPIFVHFDPNDRHYTGLLVPGEEYFDLHCLHKKTKELTKSGYDLSQEKARTQGLNNLIKLKNQEFAETVRSLPTDDQAALQAINDKQLGHRSTEELDDLIKLKNQEFAETVRSLPADIQAALQAINTQHRRHSEKVEKPIASTATLISKFSSLSSSELRKRHPFANQVEQDLPRISYNM